MKKRKPVFCFGLLSYFFALNCFLLITDLDTLYGAILEFGKTLKFSFPSYEGLGTIGEITSENLFKKFVSRQ